MEIFLPHLQFKTQGWSPDGQSILLSSRWDWQVISGDFIGNFSRYELVAVPSSGTNQIVSHEPSIAAPGVVWIKFINPSNQLEYIHDLDAGDIRYSWTDN
ncbi:hypothetical protein IMCC3135_01875 [Granulosicoccus antarcticus IMCC3135]|uniref:Uncharacterized protein n=1 Tax=Granulosicoccus antarcticus IMCC3135 TaxID=1192854 RepID=A0A2Z2NH78_9GAMM|nr:hypothetical protein IMCC3135_01875 [Granulosicoccus antarcticus IMCC3135]